MKALFKIIGFLMVLFLSTNSQTINLSGTVVDSLTSQGISGALVKIVEIPKCSTKTNTNGSFTLNYTTEISSTPFFLSASEGISFERNALLIGGVKASSMINVKVFDCKGIKTREFQKKGNKIPCTDLWQAPGWYQIKVNIDGKEYSISGMGINDSFLPNVQKEQVSVINEKDIKSAKASATYTLSISATGYIIKLTTLTNTTASLGTIKLSKPIKVNTGTGTSYTPSYVKDVTGGGAFPDTANGYRCNCDGTGATDATSCLQNAANTARAQNKPLLIPYTSGYYKISGPISVRTSVIGIGAGMPTIRQFNTSFGMTVLWVLSDMTGWIYNLHLMGTFNGTNATSEWSHGIDLGSVNGVTIKGNLIENVMGDGIDVENVCADKGLGARNVLVDNNTIKNPYRKAIGLGCLANKWVISNNILDDKFWHVPTVDYEPFIAGNQIWNVELCYNKFLLDPKTGDTGLYCDGWAVSNWVEPEMKQAGGNLYNHHNYGTFGKGFWNPAPEGLWVNVVVTNNVAGDAVPK